jgi:hypothetical protein
MPFIIYSDEDTFTQDKAYEESRVRVYFRRTQNPKVGVREGVPNAEYFVP